MAMPVLSSACTADADAIRALMASAIARNVTQDDALLAVASSDAQSHHGPLSMYLAAGFQVHRTDGEGRVYVRRSLV